MKNYIGLIVLLSAFSCVQSISDLQIAGDSEIRKDQSKTYKVSFKKGFGSPDAVYIEWGTYKSGTNSRLVLTETVRGNSFSTALRRANVSSSDDTTTVKSEGSLDGKTITNVLSVVVWPYGIGELRSSDADKRIEAEFQIVLLGTN